MIYDCFMFFNELDILELRLNILNGIVDKFVLVESKVTLKGEGKELFYENNKMRFLKFQDKITHIVYDPLKECTGDCRGLPKWFLEIAQRDAIMRGLGKCRADDVILVSDVDEIPDPIKILAYKDTPGIKVFEQQLLYYYTNFACWTHPVWCGTRMGSYSDLLDPKQTLPAQDYFAASAKGLPTYFRFCQGVNIPNAGWHFSYCGGIDNIQRKKRSITDGYDFSGDLTDAAISKAIKKGKDIHGRDIFFRIIPLSFLPKYLVGHVDKFDKIILMPTLLERADLFFHHICNIVYVYRKKIVRRLQRLFLSVLAVAGTP